MMKCRLRESRLIAINEGERSLTAADVSAVYQINGDETKRSARNRMLANSHAGRGTRLPSTWKLARPLNTGTRDPSPLVGSPSRGTVIPHEIHPGTSILTLRPFARDLLQFRDTADVAP